MSLRLTLMIWLLESTAILIYYVLNSFKYCPMFVGIYVLVFAMATLQRFIPTPVLIGQAVTTVLRFPANVSI